LKQEVITPDEPQITGALGAALSAIERARKKMG
jgi:activator of 2-hydroxyglutaryl-CoA dehydratase